jgi:aminoglycoside phosphotransferase (APT) family kinase protein
MDDSLAAPLARYLADLLGSEGGVTIESARRIHGGASRETYSFDAVFLSGGAPQRRGLILRRDPVDTLIDTERALEFAAYQSVGAAGIPVPRAVALVTDPSVLGRAFFIMERIDGGAASSPFAKDAYAPHAEAIGLAFFACLGRIARLDPAETPLARSVDVPSLQTCWSRELDHWEKVIDTDALEPQPVARAAIRALRKRPPPPPSRLALVHGDYRSGNFLHDGAGRILGILDWEMAHIGDPLEDLAWSMDPMWCNGRPDLAAGLLPRDQALRLWEEESGRAVDREALAWWELFAHLKGLAIWISAARAFADGKNIDPVLAFSGWYCQVEHNRLIAARLAAAAGA